MFIVQGKPRSPEGILKVIKHTRREAMQAANDLLEGGMAFVTIIAEGRVYTIEEFALTSGLAMSEIRHCRQRWPGCPRHRHARSRKISPPLSAASQISETTNGIS